MMLKCTTVSDAESYTQEVGNFMAEKFPNDCYFVILKDEAGTRSVSNVANVEAILALLCSVACELSSQLAFEKAKKQEVIS